jgi:hypothetical protein
MVGKLARAADIPEEELRTLSEVQVENILRIIEDRRENRISEEEAAEEMLTKTGFFDLPTPRECLDRDVELRKREYVRDIVDWYNACRLHRGFTN